MPVSLDKLALKPTDRPPLELIPAIRKIGEPNSEASDYSVNGIISRLAKLQNPSISARGDRSKFDRINQFVRVVLENDSAEIEIPYDRNMILVKMDNKTLPLHSLGTGVHEVIILASAATILNRTILCVEEPELHLHPALQRKLIRYLASETDNQYIFTTHSAHLMDAVDAEIFHVSIDSEGSVVRAINRDSDKVEVCNELGYKASDILQANCIIWVEGPSDRIYVKQWISAKRADFFEGVHYSIMFYGGKLFSHLSAENDPPPELVSDLVAVRKLNRNSMIIFDSDRNCQSARLSNTKRRLRSEFDSGPGFAWVSNGREIENYLNEERLRVSVRNVHRLAHDFPFKGRWGNLLVYTQSGKQTRQTASKVKVARDYVANNAVDFSILDLSKQINKLLRFIEGSNAGAL